MNLSLLLQDFLGLMREEGELDAFLPLLLSSMGHEILIRPQKGVRQYGVDIVSVGKDEDGTRKVFAWVVKCGDIGRTEWESGDQAIRPSVEEAASVYLPTHVPPRYASLPKKVVVVTNGDYRPTIALPIAQYVKQWWTRFHIEVVTLNGSEVATWTERHLLDENVLTGDSRTLLRRMLANVPSPEICIPVGRTLIQGLVELGCKSVGSARARQKRALGALRAIRTALHIAYRWAALEGNLVAPCRLAEFAVLAAWAGFHNEVDGGNREVARELAELLYLLLDIGSAYHEKVQPYYFVKDAFASAAPDSLLVAAGVFEELGRLGLHGLVWAFYAVVGGGEASEMAGHAEICAQRIEGLLASHDASLSPCYDHQAVDVHLALLCLMATNRRETACQWVAAMVWRLQYVAKVKKFWPLNATFQEALAIRRGQEELAEELLSTTTFVPVLCIWTAALGLKDAYDALRRNVVPAVPSTTPNVWSSDKGFDAVVADPARLEAHGVGEALLQLPEEPKELLGRLRDPLDGVSSIADSVWYKHQVPYIPLLAALHWRLQIPREMLVQQASALAAALGGAESSEVGLAEDKPDKSADA